MPQGVQHWSPYDGQVHEGIGVTDNGFWDTFRTVYPLLTLAYPKELGEIISGWLNAFKTGGWLPKWASPSYRDSMIGTYADVTIADAIVKDISGFDQSLAWEAIKKDAFSSPSDPKDTSKGKFGLQVYNALGYVPIDQQINEACRSEGLPSRISIGIVIGICITYDLGVVLSKCFQTVLV